MLDDENRRRRFQGIAEKLENDSSRNKQSWVLKEITIIKLSTKCTHTVLCKNFESFAVPLYMHLMKNKFNKWTVLRIHSPRKEQAIHAWKTAEVGSNLCDSTHKFIARTTENIRSMIGKCALRMCKIRLMDEVNFCSDWIMCLAFACIETNRSHNVIHSLFALILEQQKLKIE